MANSGISTNIGNQIVSIYSQQELSSIYGNSLLYGVLDSGVSDASLSIAGKDNIIVTIASDTKLFFTRQATDPVTGQTINTLIKVTVGDTIKGFQTPYSISSGTVSYGMSSAQWYSNFQAESKLYIVADYVYDPAAVNKYATIGVYGASALSTFNFSGVNNQVLIGVLLNNAAACASYGVNPINGITTALYHVSYEEQINRNTLTNLYNKNKDYMVQFAGDGSGVYVSTGFDFTGSSFIAPDKTLNTPEWDSLTLYAGYNYTKLLGVPSGLTQYTTDYKSGSIINIVGQESSFNQIDFLRLKKDEVTHTVDLVWESFLRPINSSIITFPPSQEQIKSYLSQQYTTLGYTNPRTNNPIFSFPLKGEGRTLLVIVRPLNSLSTSFWPEYSLNFKEYNIETHHVSEHYRNKSPVYSMRSMGLY